MTSRQCHRRSCNLLFNPGPARWAGVLVGLTSLIAPALASANCAALPAGLLWSYPGNGAVNVPTDADLFFTGQVGNLPTLDGAALERLGPGAYDLGELEPQTTYEVRWGTAVIAFTTGDGPNHAAPEPLAELELVRDPLDAPSFCPLIEPQGCFDTGAPTRVLLEDRRPKLASLIDVLQCDGSVRSLVWPAECGLPVIASQDAIVCVRSRATLGAGLSEPTDYACSVPAGDLTAIPRSSACIGAWPPAGVRTVQSAEPSIPDDDIISRVTDDTTAGNAEPAPGDIMIASDEAEGCALSPTSPHRKGSLSLLGALAAAAALLARARRR